MISLQRSLHQWITPMLSRFRCAEQQRHVEFVCFLNQISSCWINSWPIFFFVHFPLVQLQMDIFALFFREDFPKTAADTKGVLDTLGWDAYKGCGMCFRGPLGMGYMVRCDFWGLAIAKVYVGQLFGWFFLSWTCRFAKAFNWMRVNPCWKGQLLQQKTQS